ncbi:hypothetical protein V1504DRAFT_471957 [Lipomyces starkeyi]
MTQEEARTFVKARRRKGKKKTASNTQIEDYEDFGTVKNNIELNPLDTLPDNLTADAIINVGKTLSQRNTEKRQRHADAWNTVFAAAVDTYMQWQAPVRGPLMRHNSLSCLFGLNSARYIELHELLDKYC